MAIEFKEQKGSAEQAALEQFIQAHEKDFSGEHNEDGIRRIIAEAWFAAIDWQMTRDIEDFQVFHKRFDE